VVEIPIRRGGELEGVEADVVQGLIIQGEALVSILHQLMDRKSGVIGLYHSVRNL